MKSRLVAWGLVCAVALLTPGHAADDLATDALASSAADGAKVAEFTPLPALDDDWKPVDKKRKPRVWIDAKKKQVAVDGEVCLTRGYLEMFACLSNSKEHESVVAVHSKAYLLHAALLGIGAKSGSPSTWRPTYKPAHGTTIKVFVEYMEKGKPKRVAAQQWIRDLKTKKAMAHDWVFGGSSIWTDPKTKKNYYRAESGDLICVSNFPTAMLDLPIKSSQVNDELAFEAFTENIPKRGTPVRVYLVPDLPKKKDADKKDAGKKGDGKQSETTKAAAG